MPVTASRIGSSSITIDWTHLASIPAGSTQPRTHEPDPKELQEAWDAFKIRVNTREVGFYDAPADGNLSQVQECLQLAETILAKRRFTDVLFLGIGGSALGPLSLLQALEHRAKKELRFHFMENPDPIDWKLRTQGLNPTTTLVVAVTKSGTTFETMAQFLIALEWLGKEKWVSNTVAITDPEKGDLLRFAKNEGIPTLFIAPNIGGRFSIFTPVGLFAAALAGLNTSEFLAGAKSVRDYCEKTAPEKNPLCLLGSHFVRHFSRRPIHVCMPYSTRLRSVSQWWVQLWGESLGKDGKGFTPLAAVGATDQHSILQLLRDGPDDKITFFITITGVEDEVQISKLSFPASQNYGAFNILKGHTLHELLNVEYQAIAKVLSRQLRPNLTISIDRLDEKTIGALYFSFCVLTSLTGLLWGVNPYDQPGVEEGKVYIQESLSLAGSADSRRDAGENSPVNRLRRDN